MSEYISTIVYICIFIIILELILPDNKLKKYISVLCSMIIIITLISPIINIIKDENVVATISKTLDSIGSNVKIKKYDFSNLENTLIFSSVKEDVEQDILTKCKYKFNGSYTVKKVRISLNEDYTLGEINVYVKNLEQVAFAGEIIDYIAGEYSIDSGLINIMSEE